jgi:hypothetical protein
MDLKERMTIQDIRKKGAELGLFSIVDIAKHIGTNRSQIYVAVKTPEIEPSVYAKLCKFLGQVPENK